LSRRCFSRGAPAWHRRMLYEPPLKFQLATRTRPALLGLRVMTRSQRLPSSPFLPPVSRIVASWLRLARRPERQKGALGIPTTGQRGYSRRGDLRPRSGSRSTCLVLRSLEYRKYRERVPKVPARGLIRKSDMNRSTPKHEIHLAPRDRRYRERGSLTEPRKCGKNG